MRTSFEDFLLAYASDGCTVDIPSGNELNTLTEDFINELDPFLCFTSFGVEDYLDYLRSHMTDDYKHFFCLSFDERRYVHFLEIWLRGLIEPEIDRYFPIRQ